MGVQEFESTTRRKPLFNSCYNRKVQGINIAHMVVYPKTVPTSCGYRDYHRVSTLAYHVPVVQNVSWSTFDDASRRAWWSMQPRFEGEIQILNFIYEMKDFKTIAKYLLKFELSKVGSKMVALRNQLRRLSKQTNARLAAGETLSAITRTTAEARLVYSFAIMPMINDITAILKQLATTVELAQNMFADRGEVSNLSHYTEEINLFSNGNYGTSDNTRYYFYGDRSDAVFTATMQYAYRYKMRQGWDLFKRGWGLEVNAEVLWNALPFTFLVDYFYKVGQAIHTMRTDPNVFLRLSQYCESILVSSMSGISIKDAALAYLYAPYASKSTGGHTGVSGIRGTLYRRRVGNPNKGMATPRATGATNGQLWNLAALARCLFFK